MDRLRLEIDMSKRNIDCLLSGIGGRAAQVAVQLKNVPDGIEPNDERKRMFQEKWNWIKQNIRQIQMHRLWSDRIGECIGNYSVTMQRMKYETDKSVLHLFVLSNYNDCNRKLLEIMGRNLEIVDAYNKTFWCYVLNNFENIEFLYYWKKFDDRFGFIFAEESKQWFPLSCAEEKEGWRRIEKIGLKKPYVGIFSRDYRYLSDKEPHRDWSYHDYRDGDIDNLRLAIGYLKKENIMTVRMGRITEKKLECENCVDYANNFYDEFMDIVLMKNCKFFVGDNSGIICLPMALGRPVAIANMVPSFSGGMEGIAYNPKDIWIFKKYYDLKKERFLSVKEMMQFELEMSDPYNGKNYELRGVKVVSNNENEILDLVKEMNSRLDGTWVDTERDIENRKIMMELIEENRKKRRIGESVLSKCYISSSFLRSNSFLLEDIR